MKALHQSLHDLETELIELETSLLALEKILPEERCVEFLLKSSRARYASVQNIFYVHWQACSTEKEAEPLRVEYKPQSSAL